MQTSSDFLLFKAFAVIHVSENCSISMILTRQLLVQSQKKNYPNHIKNHAKTAMKDIFSVNCQAH